MYGLDFYQKIIHKDNAEAPEFRKNSMEEVDPEKEYDDGDFDFGFNND